MSCNSPDIIMHSTSCNLNCEVSFHNLPLRKEGKFLQWIISDSGDDLLVEVQNYNIQFIHFSQTTTYKH